MKKSILLISGPNLNMLGRREPELYGTTTLDELVELARKTAKDHDYNLQHLQSNHEGTLIDAIQGAQNTFDAIVINAGAFTHYAWALQDALRTFLRPIVELHLTDPKKREDWRHLSVIEPVADLVIAGMGADGYRMAIEQAIGLVEKNE